uniref:ETS domain-containing protein n=1 Tax=Mesocestoides corti TaxID=53468 RepID=A0A5K3EVR3_MESCO
MQACSVATLAIGPVQIARSCESGVPIGRATRNNLA